MWKLENWKIGKFGNVKMWKCENVKMKNALIMLLKDYNLFFVSNFHPLTLPIFTFSHFPISTFIFTFSNFHIIFCQKLEYSIRTNI